MRIPVSIFSFLVLFASGCRGDSESYNFDDASEEAQQAIATNVEYVLTENGFRKWEKAQANLERLPAGELDRAPDPGGTDPVARGILRLESSPPARRAIESAGLSVKNFVMATVALAQAVKASRGGVPPTVGAIASNVRFVMNHASRVSSRGAATVWVPPSELSEEELAAQDAMEMETDSSGEDDEMEMDDEIAEPTVPPFPPFPKPQPELPPRDTSPENVTPVEPSRTDSLTLY